MVNLNPICWADQCFSSSKSNVESKYLRRWCNSDAFLVCLIVCLCKIWLVFRILNFFEYVISRIINLIDVLCAVKSQYVQILYDCSLCCVFDWSIVPVIFSYYSSVNVLLDPITVLLMFRVITRIYCRLNSFSKRLTLPIPLLCFSYSYLGELSNRPVADDNAIVSLNVNIIGVALRNVF